MKKTRPRARRHVHLHTLGARVSLVIFLTAFSMAGVAVASFLQLRDAAVRDAEMHAAALARTAARGPELAYENAEEALGRIAAGAGCEAAAGAAVNGTPGAFAAGLASDDGRVLCGTPAALALSSVADAAFFRRAAAAETAAVGDYALAGGRPAIGVALRTSFGVAFALLAPDAFDPGIDPAAYPKGSVIGVVDGKAVIIAYRPDALQRAGDPLSHEALMNEMFSRKDGAAVLEGRDGTERFYGFARIARASPAPLYLFVGIPEEAMVASTSRAVVRNAVVGGFLAFILIWAAFVIADVIIFRKFRGLVAAMRNAVAGDLEARNDLQYGFGELDELTGLFDEVIGRLRDARSHIEDSVKKRTVELEFGKGMAELEKARIEALLSSIGEGVLAADQDGKVIFSNVWAEHMLGMEAARMVGSPVRTVLRLIDEKGKPIDDEKLPVRRALESGKRVDTPLPPKPFYLSRADRKTMPVQITVTPIALGDRIIGVIAVFRDITDEMEIDRRKSEFISIASHQLRSPLTGLKWLIDMLRKGDMGALEPKQQDAADRIFDASERLVTLVNELLNVSRLEAGTTKPTPQPTDMGKLIDDVVADTKPLLDAKKQEFVVDKKKLPTMMLDPLLIREVVANLISNASKYSPDGTAVMLKAEPSDGEVLISVADQGMGIPLEQQKQMFSKFFRAENAAKSTIQGTGLGLYVCKQIVELSGGRIWFESAEGKGTTFFVRLPVAVASGAAAAKDDKS